MKKFEFKLDQKVSIWMRTEFEVEAETLAEAKIEAKRMFEAGDTGDMPWEEIENTQELLTVDPYGGESTAELYADEESSPYYLNNE